MFKTKFREEIVEYKSFGVNVTGKTICGRYFSVYYSPYFNIELQPLYNLEEYIRDGMSFFTRDIDYNDPFRCDDSNVMIFPRNISFVSTKKINVTKKYKFTYKKSFLFPEHLVKVEEITND